jgi:ketosteroid isomerase-like protein
VTDSAARAGPVRIGCAQVRNSDAERFVRDVWAAFRKEGVDGVLAFAADDAEWRPHSAHRRSFASTAEYREQLERFAAEGERVEATATGMWSHRDVVLVRGRMRIRRRGGVLEDTRMYWLFGVRGGKLARVASSPDLAGLLRDAGYDDPVLAREAFIALHRDARMDRESGGLNGGS